VRVSGRELVVVGRPMPRRPQVRSLPSTSDRPRDHNRSILMGRGSEASEAGWSTTTRREATGSGLRQTRLRRPFDVFVGSGDVEERRKGGGAYYAQWRHRLAPLSATGCVGRKIARNEAFVAGAASPFGQLRSSARRGRSPDPAADLSRGAWWTRSRSPALLRPEQDEPRHLGSVTRKI